MNIPASIVYEGGINIVFMRTNEIGTGRTTQRILFVPGLLVRDNPQFRVIAGSCPAWGLPQGRSKHEKILQSIWKQEDRL